MKKIRWIVVVGILKLTLATSVLAADSSTSGWKWRLAPLYLWGANISGDQTIGPISLPIDLKFKDIFDNLETIFTVNFEGIYKDRWGFLIDFNYMDLKGSQDPLTVNFQNILAEADGLYRVRKGKHNIDLLFGLRYTEQEAKVEPTPVTVSQDWTDPVIGGRWLWYFAEKWSLMLRGDIGGFGVGSDFTWQAAGFIDWQLFKHVSFAGGYRALYQDYEDNGQNIFKYKATIHGPLLGVNIRW